MKKFKAFILMSVVIGCNEFEEPHAIIDMTAISDGPVYISYTTSFEGRHALPEFEELKGWEEFNRTYKGVYLDKSVMKFHNPDANKITAYIIVNGKLEIYESSADSLFSVQYYLVNPELLVN